MENVLDSAQLDGKSIIEWSKVRAIPSILSYDLYNAVFPADTKYDFLGREIEKSSIIGIVRDDKTNDIIIEFNDLEKQGYMPVTSNPSGAYAKELQEKLGDEKYYEVLSGFQKDYAEEVSIEINSEYYKGETPEEKKKSIDELRDYYILDELKNY